MSLEIRTRGFWTRHLDEAIRLVELRRYARILTSARLPLVYAIGIFVTSGMLVPLFFGERGILAGADPINNHRGWAAGTLFTAAALAAAVGAFLRAQYLWQRERQLHSFHTWLLTRQEPTRAVVTTVLMAALLGLGLTAAPALCAIILALFAGFQGWQFLLHLLLLPLCALAGAALGAATFFVNWQLAPARLLYPGVLALALGIGGLWLRIESVERGWQRPWEEHPGRIARAVTLATPAPVLFGAAAPTWWQRYMAPGLGDAPVPAAALAYAAFLLALAGYATRIAARGYLRLAEEPDLLARRPQAATEESGPQFYWKGFRNPVWTRDIRTRLRSKDTAEFIFFASVVVAAGAFVPLILTVNDLSDPLQTARAARQVFFWLTMTLVALVTLVAPGLTADVLTQERNQGTLEMLVGTTLRPREILVGKLLGAVSVMLLLITPSLPLFGLCYLFHGASADQVLGVYGLLLLTVGVSALIGLTQSAIHNRSGIARFWAYASTAVFVAFPGGPFWMAATVAAPQAEMRQSLASQAYIGAAMAVFWLFFLCLFWGNAREQLEYAEY